MRNIWLVTKHDVGTTMRQRSFWLLTFLMPVLLIGLNAYSMIRDSGLDIGTGADTEEEIAEASEPLAIGLVDPAGFLAEVPPEFPADPFTRYADEGAALAALEAGQIAQYVFIPQDYLSNGEVTVYDENFQILRGDQAGVAFDGANEWVLQYLLNYNLTGDEQLVAAVGNPPPGNLAERHVINPPQETTDKQSEAFAELVAGVLPYIFYFLLLMGGSYCLRTVVAEKENRTAEVLLLSVDPREMMVGKLLAGTFVLVVQLAIWLGGGLLVLNRAADLLNLASFEFPPGFLFWAALYLVLGYLLFASVMSAAGAIAPNVREGNQVIWLLVLPLMPTLMFGRLFAEDPDSAFALILSLFPLSAPSAMVTRLAVGEVPLWQLLIGLAGLAATTYLFIVLSARFFKAGNLLSDASFNWRRFATAWRK